MKIRYPVYQPLIGELEKEYVRDCLETTWISSKGAYIEKFEREFADFCGLKYSASTSNGTTALHTALLACGIGPGDEVIVPTFTYIASVNAIRYCGAEPVFVDSESLTWQMDPGLLEQKISPRTRAILAVHLYGHPCDMDRIMGTAAKHGLRVIEDCAESIGTRYWDRMTGTFGDIAAFSFFGNKTITTGEGGMVLSNQNDLIEKAKIIKGQGLDPSKEYWHTVIGYNYRMTNIEAAIGLAQLTRIREVIEKKRQIASWYRKNLDGLPVVLHPEKEGAFHTYWMVTILVESDEKRMELRSYLRDHGIETRPAFHPVHKMPMYDHQEIFPVAEDLALRGINLPSYPGLSAQDVQEICHIIKMNYA